MRRIGQSDGALQEEEEKEEKRLLGADFVVSFCLQSRIRGCPRIYITIYGIWRVNIYELLISLAPCPKQVLGSMYHHDCFGLNISENNHSELLSPKLEGIKMGSLWEMTSSITESQKGDQCTCQRAAKSCFPELCSPPYENTGQARGPSQDQINWHLVLSLKLLTFTTSRNTNLLNKPQSLWYFDSSSLNAHTENEKYKHHIMI